MITLMLATVFAMHIDGSTQAVGFNARAGQTYRVTVASHCDCYALRPTVAVPVIGVYGADGQKLALPASAPKTVQRKAASSLDLVSDITVTANADGMLFVHVTSLPMKGAVTILERLDSSGGGFSGPVLTSSLIVQREPVNAAGTGDVTVTVEPIS